MEFRRIKRDFHFSKNEVIKLVIVSLIFGVMFSFRKWGESSIDYNLGLENLAIFSILSFIALFIHFSAEKIYACNKALKNEYKTNPYALGVGLYVTLLFNGLIYILSPGYLFVKTIKEKRVGKFRYRSNFLEFSMMAISGIMSNLLLAGLLIGFSSNSLISSFVLVNLIIAIFSLLPVPFTDGFYIITASFYHYAFMLSFTLVFFFMILYTNIILASIFGVIAGVSGVLYWFFKN